MNSISAPLGHVWNLCLFTTLTASASEPFNYLFINVDDLRPDIHALGAEHMHTPHMDRLVREGRAFTRHYVQVPSCGPSRYAMYTGRRPASHQDTVNRAFDQMPVALPAEPESFVDLFRRNGWHTVSIGKNSHAGNGIEWTLNAEGERIQGNHPDMRFSWDEIILEPGKWGAKALPGLTYADGSHRIRGVSLAYEIGVDASGNSLPDEGYPDGLLAAAAVEKLREFKDTGTRFLLSTGFYKPHLAFNAPKAYWDLYDREQLPAPDPPTVSAGAMSSTTGQSGEAEFNYGHYWEDGSPAPFENDAYRRLLRHGYFASVSYIDAQVGKLLDALDELGLAENTVVVLWGDHGWCLDDYDRLGKHLVFERALLSPLIIRLPVQPFPGETTSGIVESIDIYPTLAALSGLAAPDSVDGSSLVPMLYNPRAPGKGWAYSRQASTMNIDSVRTEDWRLIRSSNAYDLYDLKNNDWEVEDVSSQNSETLQYLIDTKLNVQSVREGTLSYNIWRSMHFTPSEIDEGLISEPHHDPDQDGWSNGWEAIGGTDPRDPADRPAYGRTLCAASGGWVVRFSGQTNFDDIAFLPQWSDDLSQWHPVANRFLGFTPLGDSTFQHTFSLSEPEAASLGSQFIRLKLIHPLP